MTDVGVAVLTYRPGPELTQTIDAVLRSGADAERVVIVDNASPAEALASARATYSKIAVLALPTNVGYGAAMNQAARRLRDAGCRHYLFLTQETRLAPHALDHLVSHVNVTPRLGLVGPLLALLSRPGEVWSAGGAFSRLSGKPVHRWRGRPIAATSPGLFPAQWLDGACLLARSEAFEEVGGFREDLFLYWEDVHLSLAVAQRGWQVCCATDALALQEPSMTPPYLMARNRALVLGARGVIGSGLDVLRWGARDVATGRGLRRAALGAAGLRDAVRGARLDHDRALERP